ncbi:urease accessory protein UreE [Aestuariicoccus sp. MJ-SS9]|uniref:urease accessory protein UreE n=1 Tax=Aestuariicoccus sp. MJ-SS9 TaxID=3079855 RepID=UPI00290BF735|nr:urease accessory protein UreE [Aestuariicoccus sp. MJ-SS9]MDU8912037.1 urease accessory protein UreE [Aestuariicoccus sp. MJ-SS9]
MSAPSMTARAYHPHAHASPADRLVLTYEDRFLRRKVLGLASGQTVLVDLAKTTSLDHGGVLITTDGREIAVEAAPEPLLAVTGPDLPRIAWHIGNRHTPCQIEADRLLIQRDHVIADMLTRIGATVTEVTEPFTPEGGAYGHGRTHGHDHSHSHGPQDHSHEH